MAPYMICCILLQMFLLSNAQYGLTVHPMKKVLVPLGGSIQLNCSINCHQGKTSWKGLDTILNGQYIAPGYSVQTFKNISTAMSGTRICVGTCPHSRSNLQESVELLVYALPQTLPLSINMKNGIPYLNCSMKAIFPFPEISCYRGSENLGDPIYTDAEEDGDQLITATWSWKVHEDRVSETSYRCEATVIWENHVLKREGTLKISNKVKTTAAVTASSTFQMAVTISNSLETPYLKTTIAASKEPETTYGMQQRTTLASKDPETTYRMEESTTLASKEPETYGMQQRTTLASKDPETTYRMEESTTLASKEPETYGMQQRTTLASKDPETTYRMEESTTLASKEPETYGMQQRTTLASKDPETTYRMEESTTLASKDPETTYGMEESTTLASKDPETTYGMEESTTLASKDPETTYGMEERTTLGNELSTFPDTTTDTMAQNHKTQKTFITTRIPRTSARPDFTHLLIITQEVPPKDPTTLSIDLNTSKESLSLSPEITRERVINIDWLNFALMAAPAAGLAGSVLLSLQIWRHLNRKGSFQPKQIDGLVV